MGRGELVRMKPTSRQVFLKHFAPESLREIIDLHLAPSTARGVDGTNYERFIEKQESEVELISSRAISGNYHFSPYRQKLIIKDAKSPPRQVSIPTIRDKIALRALNNFLSELYHDARPQHSHPVISSVISSIHVASPGDAFIKLDIRSFYDGINHKVLLGNLRRKIRSDEPIALIEAAMTTPTGATVSEKEINQVGVPQGLSLSNILASIYLRDIDKKYEAMTGVTYHRYVDDILCIVPSANAESIAKSISGDLLKRKKLKSHPIGSGKSDIFPISESVDYLGYCFSGGRVTVRKSTEKKLLSSLMRIIHSANSENLTRSLWRLNLRISGCRINQSNVGWIFYFSQINDLKLLSRVDAQVKKSIKAKFGEVEYSKCKRLIKAYHEVKFNLKDSGYFYNFDKYSRAMMVELLTRVFPGRFYNLDVKSDADIQRIFNRVVTREVREMERDTLGGFS